MNLSAAAFQTGSISPAQLPFAAFPVGSFLDRYVVLQVYRESRQANYYLVEEMVTGRAGTRWLLKETSEWVTVQAQVGLHGRSLTHPALRLAQRHWVARDYNGAERHYLLFAGPDWLTLEGQNATVELDQACRWIGQLAQGLAYLHQQQIALGPVGPAQVCIQDGQAMWFDLGEVKSPASPADVQANVQSLGALFLFMLTRSYVLTPDLVLPPAVRELIRQTSQGHYVRAQDWLIALGQLTAAPIPVSPPPAPSSGVTPQFDLRLGRRTDAGRVRQINQDSLLTLDLGWINRSHGAPLGVYAVADGLGGGGAGETASQLALAYVAQKAAAAMLTPFLSEYTITHPDLKGWMRQVTQEAIQTVDAARQGRPMSSTLVWAVVSGYAACIANAGDSRAYVLDRQAIRQITADHLTADGQVSPAQVDVFETRLPVGGFLLLCSDGLTDLVQEPVIHQLVLSSNSPQHACDRLIAAANQAGGSDNIAIILIQVDALLVK